MADWLVVGSSPSVVETIHAVKDMGLSVITTNSGIKLIFPPDVYFLSDKVACRKFEQEAKIAQALGTRLVTLDRVPSALESRGVTHFDEYVMQVRDGYEPFQLSGLACVEYACKRADRRVVLVGMDGYWGDVQSFDDTAKFGKYNQAKTLGMIPDRMSLLCDKYPHLLFEVYGRPHYTVNKPNWRVM